MIIKSILPADTFSVINKTIINSSDSKILIMLYQPIIGSNAITLYLTMQSYLDKLEIMSVEWTHHHLMTSMRMSLKDIMEAREKLEGIGLIKTYYKEGNINNYIYELYSPLSACEFINNPILSLSLYNNVGKNEFNKIVEYFKFPKIDLKNYTDITKSFNDVFDMVSASSFDYMEEIRGITKNDLDIIKKFDLDELLELIPEEMLNRKIVTKEIKELIYKLSFIYSLEEDKMIEVIKNSINEKHGISKDLLRKNCKNFYTFEHNGKSPSLMFKNQPEYLRSIQNSDSKKSKLIYQFETISPYQFLLSKNNGAKPTNKEIEILDYLLLDLNMMPGVVNVLIDYVLKINDNKLVKNFVVAIASQWIKNNVQTVSDAMDLAEKEHKKRKNKIVKNKEQIKSLPKWFNKEIDEEIDNDKVKEIEEMLSKFK